VSELPALGDTDTLARTRDTWHQVAEHVLAPARYQAVGRIGLRVTSGGFGTPPYDRGGTTEALHVVGSELRVARGDATVAHPLTTIAAAAKAAGIEPGAPAEVYSPTTPLDPDAPLEIDVGAARALAAWFELGWSVLEDLVRAAGQDAAPSTLTLWPEHFDAAVELGREELGTRGTFGASPGDALHDEPYLYVTHWFDVGDDEYWNETAFAGASLPYSAAAAATSSHGTMLDFLRAGLALLSAPHT